MTEELPVFDGHNDFLLRLWQNPALCEELWLRGDGGGHLDLPRMRKGGFAGGFFAIYIPSPEAHDSLAAVARMKVPPYLLPLGDLIGAKDAQPVALAMAGHLRWMERVAPDDFKVCTDVAGLRDCLARGVISAIMHMEGAEAIGPRSGRVACVSRHGAAVGRAGLVAAHGVWPWGAVWISGLARYRRGADGGGQAVDLRLQ